MSTMKVKCVAGRLVYMPEMAMQKMPTDRAVTVQRNAFYLNHLRCGDIEIVDVDADTATSTESAATGTGVDANGKVMQGEHAKVTAGASASGTVGNAVNGTGTQTGTAGAAASPSATEDTKGPEGDPAESISGVGAASPSFKEPEVAKPSGSKAVPKLS